jgi:predicted glycogen debranching enzyme
MIELARKHLQDFEPALENEWLETNGLGGYASSTVLGVNTRKYHGLLTVALKPPVDRVSLVSRVDEALIIGDSRFELAASEYEDTVYPDGFRYLEGFRLDPFPVFSYVAGGLKLAKSIFMIHGKDITCVLYRLTRLPGGPDLKQVRLEVRPMLAFRSHHDLVKESRDFDGSVTPAPTVPEGGEGIRLRPHAQLPPLYVRFSHGRFEEAAYWYRNYRYRREQESGYAWNEDLYSPGAVALGCDSGECWLTLSTSEAAPPGPELELAERERRAALVAGPLAEHPVGRHLLPAADAFVAKRGEAGCTLIAGYPWFSDWGRDTMISLPGLTLATGRYGDARRILETYAASMAHGLIPNLFPDFSDTARYNTIDATLWLFEAVRKYFDVTGDREAVTALLPHLRSAMRAHVQGTLYGIGMADDGLLRGGAEGVQLTWMDAMFQDEVITARRGKPVEINALWYNAIRIMADFSADFGGLAEERKYAELAARVGRAFNSKFWNEERDCLYDCLDGPGKDDSIRPNQVIAMSLTYPVLAPSRWKSVIDVVERELLTPCGLRTLSPNDPRYKGVYEGDLAARDRAYHQGTVWAWLIGPYIKAYIRACGRSEKTLIYCSRLLEGFVRHLGQAGLGQVSEIFDGDPPHRPRGCIAQAWSVAEILRAIAEDILPLAGSPPKADNKAARVSPGGRR